MRPGSANKYFYSGNRCMYALEIKNLEKIYDNGFKALNKISFAVEPGDFFALLGPNGAGKTTIIGIIASLVKKTSGDVNVYGYSIEKDWSKAKSLIGLVPQEFNFAQFETVEFIVMTQAGYYGIPRKIAKKRAEYYLKKLDLWDKRQSMSRMLSGGMKRRLMIARALMHEPKLLILDEPTAGVDIEIRRATWEFMREINANGTTIILTTHYLEEAENLCRNIAIIDRGNIIEISDMANLLKRLHTETFVLYLSQPLQQLPEIHGYNLKQMDAYTLEADIGENQTLSGLFHLLSEQQIAVNRMRNKTNRLEELFLKLIN